MRAALFSLLILATPALQAADDYYPLAVGTQWTYKFGDKDDKLVMTSLKTAKVLQHDCVVLEAKVNGKPTGSEHVAVLKDGAYRFMAGDKNYDPPICFFMPSAKKGDTWKQEFKFGDTKGTITFSVDVQDVEVPAGKFKDVLVVQVDGIETTPKTDTAPAVEAVSKATIYYAKNFGMIKQVFIDGEKSVVLELEKMEAPKK